MHRRYFLGLSGALAACVRKPESAGPLLPETVAQVWQRKNLRELPGSSAPDPVPPGGAKRVLQAEYGGPGSLQADVYDLSSSALALDMAQRWRPAADTVFFYRDNYFVVVKWQQADRKLLNAFVRELDQAFAARAPK